MAYLINFLLCLLLPTFASGEDTHISNNPYLSHSIIKHIKPFIIPKNHPALPTLNKIFSKSRPIIDEKTLKEAGFRILCSKPRSFIRVVRHPDLPGYLLKVNLDSDKRQKFNKPAWHWFVRRCQGAKILSFAIQKCHSKHFQVAKKWIYVLPPSPPPPQGNDFRIQPVVLLVEDMKIYDSRISKMAWDNKFTKRHLDELYEIITLAGGSSYRPDNVCLRRKGNSKFAFIDTEYPNNPPDYGSVTSYLKSDLKDYWLKKIN